MQQRIVLQWGGLMVLAGLLWSGGSALAQSAATPPAAPGGETQATGAGEPAAETPDGEGLLLDIPAVPPSVLLPEPGDPDALDVPGDDGKALGVLWNWIGATTETTTAQVQVLADPAWLDALKLSPDDQSKLERAGTKYKQQLDELTPKVEAAEAAVGDADTALAAALADNSSEAASLRRARWTAAQEVARLTEEKNHLDNALESETGKLLEKDRQYRYLSAALAAAPDGGLWLDTNVAGPAAALVSTKGEAANRFGLEPDDPDKLYFEVNGIAVPRPAELEGQPQDMYGQAVPPAIQLPLSPGANYKLQLLVSDSGTSRAFPLGEATPHPDLFIATKTNVLLATIVFGLIIIGSIALARKNPNLFIRRIAGLEAVDEAIGRATEMGKPVFYLNGMTTLADLSTLAAVNILGRVARKVAEYDSALLVPCRDPVVMGVAQEVVREGFLDMGRPDAYREDNVFFLTDDQFSYTASVCALMVREKPAANFFMGYYYAESLLLAETGASTGAIQIAGTDSVSQLPFFITACDYTLIGEELYAASAYLSREPMLLGSLKGQDAGKALIMLLIVVQTLLFLFNPEFDWLRSLVKAL
jgi:hypothetical protein